MSTTQITDGVANTVAVNTALPAAAAPGLTVREAAQGQQTMANSQPITIASDQSALSITGTKTNNSATPGTNNFGTLPAVATTAVPSYTTGNQVALSTDLSGNLRVLLGSSSNSSGNTLLGVQRVSQQYRIFAYEFSQGDNSVYWDTSLTTGGTATYTANANYMALSITGTTNSQVIRQTRQRFFYQVGLTTSIQMGLIVGTGAAGVTKRWGVFDAQDGIFFSQVGATLNVNTRTFASGAAVDTTVAQASWNLDKLNGTGASGVTLNLSDIVAYIIEYDWWGSGTARLGIIYNGSIIYCHQFLEDDVITSPYVSRATLPIRIEMTNTGGGPITTMQHFSASVYNDSGQPPLGIIRTIDTFVLGGTLISNAALTPLLSLRLLAANNKALLLPLRATFSHTSTAVVGWRGIFNGTLTGATFAQSPIGNNVISQFDVAATVVANGDVFFGGTYVGGSGGYATYDLTSPVNLSSNIAGTADILTIAAERNGAATTVFCTITYMELI